MRKEFVYSFMALGAIPVVVNAADVQTISSDVLASTDGSKVTYAVGKLVKGNYTFQASLLSKVYGVTIKIGNQTLNLSESTSAQEVNIGFELTAETDIELTLESTDPGEAGAGFTVADALVKLNFNFATIKSTLATNAETLASAIGAYNYAAKQEDVDAANALKTKANGIAESYDDYKKYKLYADKSTIQEEIDQLASSAAAKEAAYQNEQAYNRVNAKITAIKNKYNTAVANIQTLLTGTVAEYLLDAALAELNTEINAKITAATSASYSSYQAGTAVADEAANTASIPTETALNDILDDYDVQKTNNVNAYNALHAVVTDLQAALNAIVPVEAIASLFPKTEAQNAINAINTKVENAKNSAAQLTLNVDADKSAAQTKINTLAGKVNTANAEYNANVATTTAIAAVQKKLDDAKTAVNAKVSADGQYKAQDYYAAYVENVQTEINKLTSDAAAAYKADGTGSAQTYNAGLATKVSTIEALITPYETNAIAAVAAYDALQTAIAGYQSALDDARNKMKDLAIYTDASYDYQTKLDLLQKRINDIKKAIATAKGKVGTEHWAAMIAVDADAAIATDVADLVDSYQADQNEYDANALTTGITSLGTKISTFAAKDASTLGADVATFQAVETDINTAYTAIKTASEAINANSDFVDYTAKVGTSKDAWHGSGTYSDLVELFGNTAVGVKLYQDVAVEDGIYDIIVKATSHNAHNGNWMTPTEDSPVPALQEDADDVAYVFGKGENEVKTWITARKNSGMAEGEPGTYEIKGVNVKDGKLTIGLALDKKGQTEWHTIQIVSLKANTASLIQAWGAKIAKLNTQQTALETVAGTVEGKVAGNTTAKNTNSTNIGNLQTAMGTFATTYKVGQDNSTLGNRGKAGGSVTTEVEAINTALGTLNTNNAGVDITVVTPSDKTAAVDNTWGGIGTAGAWAAPFVTPTGYTEAIAMREHYNANSCQATGVIITQTIENVENGIYDVQLFANANHANSVDNDHAITGDADDVAYIFANGVEIPITAKNANTNATNGEYTISKVIVSDGTLTIGLGKYKAGTNWHSIQIKSLSYHDNTNPALAEYNNQYLALANRKATLDAAAPGIKAAVEANANALTTANQTVSDLQTAELNTLKSLENVTNASAVSDDATAKKADPADWKVFETGLDADKTYTAKKNAIDADILAMSTAIANSAAAETLVADWQNNSITVVTGQDPQTQADITKTYSIAELTIAINNLKTEAEAENANYKAYKSLQENNMPKLTPDTITVNADYMGAGAVTYYQGLKDQYIADKATILSNMKADLNARKAVSTQTNFVNQIAALILKVKAVNTDGSANWNKYKEQKAAYTETQTLWNSTYTEIAATDHSSVVQSWLDELDAIQVTLTAATEAVETNYPLGKSVAEAKDFAAIKAAINDVKARQSQSYNAAITADNKAAHESFMGTETTKGAIQLATEAYQKAVQDRAKYSSTNDAIKNVVDAAAAELDEALFNCPTAIAALTNAENEAYAAIVSPEIFDVTSYNAQATQIEQNITNALNQFKADVKTAIQGFWTPKKNNYNSKVTAAEGDIAAFCDEAKTNAFKDVKDLIAKGNTGVESMTLSEVEAAIEGLANIDAMLAADKDVAADKDITSLLNSADTKYNEVKNYINGISNDIPAKSQQLTILENAYNDGDASDNDVAYAKSLVKNFANRNTVAGIVGDNNVGFIKKANDCKTTVSDAVTADNNNTAAYNDIIAAITPVEAKLAKAKAAVAPYKYDTSFDTDEMWLNNDKEWADDAKQWGYAVTDKTALLNDIADIDADIDATLTAAFNTEKAGLATDITELKNQFNAYVAAKGLNATATAFKTDIDNLEAALNEINIVEVDDPADGVKYNDILVAVNALVSLQNDIADKETELLDANARTLNADVLADFTSQLGNLASTASLEGYDEWVGQQMYGGKTLDEQIGELQAQIADLKAAIEAEPNISFYKDQYQAKITAIKNDLEPVAQAITNLDAQCKANAAAYATLIGQINELQGKIDAAKAKVGAYEYNGIAYDGTDIIEEYNDEGQLIGGVQYWLNYAKSYIDYLNGNKALNQNSTVLNKAPMEYDIQYYLDWSAHFELISQRDNLSTLLTNAIDVANHVGVQKYSSALWARLVNEKDGINKEIVALAKDMYKSSVFEEGSFDVVTSQYDSPYLVDGYYNYYFTLDDNDNPIYKDWTCDADFAAQMAVVNTIKGEIADLATAVDNLDLLGDANVDGKVNVLDYQKVINMILDPTLQPADDTDLFVNIDVNQSTVIEVGDLTAIVNYILNHNWPYGYAAARGAEVEGESLAMTTNSQANGKQRIAVNLTNVSDYTAFQMDVVLPNGMTIVGAELSDRAGESHKFYTRKQLDGSVRMLASSVKGETFSGNEGAVLYIDVETTGEYMGGNVELLNILFSDVNAQTRSFAIGSDATGIDTMSTFEALKQKVYDLGGRVKNGLKKGINIIRRADGSTEKVVK